MVHCCPECSGTKSLRDFVTAELFKLEIDEVEYSQWQCTDWPTLITIKVSTEEYIDTLANPICDLTTQ